MSKPKSIFEWHYPCRNPDDLPGRNLPVYCFIQFTEKSEIIKGYSVGFYNGTDWIMKDKKPPFTVLNWCEMEPEGRC